MKHRVFDGTGKTTPVRHTGQGAPSAAGKPKLLSNNWGAKTMSKLQGTASAPGYDRFMQPTDAATAQVTPPGLGNGPMP